MVATVKFADNAPAGTETVDGMVTGSTVLKKPRESFDDNTTVAPPAGAGSLKCNTPCAVAPPITVFG